MRPKVEQYRKYRPERVVEDPRNINTSSWTREEYEDYQARYYVYQAYVEEVQKMNDWTYNLTEGLSPDSKVTKLIIAILLVTNVTNGF